jgi:LruC domain-containing protein
MKSYKSVTAMKMKNLIAVSVLALSLQFVSAQNVELDFESGRIDTDAANCWIFADRSFSYTNKGPEVISGRWSGKTRKLDVQSDIYVKSPWMLVSSGNVTLKIKFSKDPGPSSGIEILYIPVNESAADKEGTPVSFYTEMFHPPFNQVISVSAPLPSAIAGNGNSYRIMINLLGRGSKENAYFDDISISGTYNSDPSKGCTPKAPVSRDQDGDGVEDAYDDYPSDGNLAYNNYFPTATTFGTLMFEDNWPLRGDYDFNDLVLGYRINTVTNASGKVAEQVYTFEIRAIGANYHNGFGFQLMNIPSASIVSVSGNNVSGGYSFASNGLEAGQSQPTIIVFDDAFRFFATNGMVNTNPSQGYITPHTMAVKVTFIQNGVIPSGGTVTPDQLTIGNFNPFIVIDAVRGHEVHLPWFSPTDLADASLFGTGEDVSDPGSGRCYITKNNLPWSLNVPVDISYPKEYKEITLGYLKFEPWAISGGSNYPDWYLDLGGYRDNDNLY